MKFNMFWTHDAMAHQLAPLHTSGRKHFQAGGRTGQAGFCFPVLILDCWDNSETKDTSVVIYEIAMRPSYVKCLTTIHVVQSLQCEKSRTSPNMESPKSSVRLQTILPAS